jgi:hypothetical protein
MNESWGKKKRAGKNERLCKPRYQTEGAHYHAMALYPGQHAIQVCRSVIELETPLHRMMKPPEQA